MLRAKLNIKKLQLFKYTPENLYYRRPRRAHLKNKERTEDNVCLHHTRITLDLEEAAWLIRALHTETGKVRKEF